VTGEQPVGDRYRTYGEPPYRVVVVHGGPGAPGYMAPVARELAARRGVLEPLQTASTLDGQIAELADAVRRHASPPAVLIGSSWGAMLSFLVAAHHPELVRSLVLVGCAVFDPESAREVDRVRLGRLAPSERAELRRLQDRFLHAEVARTPPDRAEVARLDELLLRASHVELLTTDTETLSFDAEVHAGVWPAFEALRASGGLVALGRAVRCPVLAVHGDHDPHAAAGVRDPLAAVVGDFRFVLLERCGHLPWLERGARRPFFEVVEEELARVGT
jgi:pimeloyl-ACP methyl ester carboxylesterase